MKLKMATSQTHPMILKQPDLPPAVARDFVKDMEAYFAEEDRHKRDEIAAHQLKVLQRYQKPRDGKYIKRMFEQSCSPRARELICLSNRVGVEFPGFTGRFNARDQIDRTAYPPCNGYALDGCSGGHGWSCPKLPDHRNSDLLQQRRFRSTYWQHDLLE